MREPRNLDFFLDSSRALGTMSHAKIATAFREGRLGPAAATVSFTFLGLSHTEARREVALLEAPEKQHD
jgi:hypothetical protein